MSKSSPIFVLNFFISRVLLTFKAPTKKPKPLSSTFDPADEPPPPSPPPDPALTVLVTPPPPAQEFQEVASVSTPPVF